MFFENFIFSLRRARAAPGPYFLPLQKVGKDRRKGVSPPCESPDQSGVLDAPLWKPPSLAALSGLAELLAACAAGASVPLGKAASAYALATAAAPPPLRLGASPPGPLRFQMGNVCRSCAKAHGTAFVLALRATPPQISRKLLPRKRLGVPSLPSRGCAEGTLARPQRGNPKGGAALFGQSLPTFCWPESRGPARPERVEGRSKIYKKQKRDNKRLPAKKRCLRSAPQG